jgi:hypothetical protein
MLDSNARYDRVIAKIRQNFDEKEQHFLNTGEVLL